MSMNHTTPTKNPLNFANQNQLALALEILQADGRSALLCSTIASRLTDLRYMEIASRFIGKEVLYQSGQMAVIMSYAGSGYYICEYEKNGETYQSNKRASYVESHAWSGDVAFR